MAAKKFKVGDSVRFLGYSEEIPEDEQVLDEGSTYPVVEVNDKEKSLAVEITNPDFNPKKKETEENAKTILVDVFFNEVEPDDGEEEEAPAPKTRVKKTPAKTSRASAKQEEEDDEEDDEEEEEEEEEAPPAKKTAAKKAPAKTAAKKAPAKKTAAKKTTAKGKAKAPAKKEEEQEDELPDLENEDAEIVQLVEEADDILELAEELVEEGAALDYKLGGVLYHVRKEKSYQALDDRYKEKGGFGLYVKEKLNIEYRKAMYLIDIYYKFNLFGIEADKLQEIGWAKASKISAVMSEDNAEELVELAESSTLADLNDTIKESYKVTNGEAPTKTKRITFKFRLLASAADSVKEILEQQAKDMGVKDISDAFEHIVMEWAAEHMNVKKSSSIKATAKTTGKTTRRQAEAAEA